MKYKKFSMRPLNRDRVDIEQQARLAGEYYSRKYAKTGKTQIIFVFPETNRVSKEFRSLLLLNLVIPYELREVDTTDYK